MLECQQLGVRFEAFALGPIDLAIAAGEIVFLLGANGAGKSTTLAALAGQIRGYTGSVRYNGRELRELLPEYRQRIGLLPEKLAGFGWMTVRERLRFISAFYPNWDQAYCESLISGFRLDPDAKVGTLSKGNAMKLAYIAAESHKPPLLLLDEPTSGLDPVARGALLEQLREMRAALPERVVIYSTHILEDVGQLATRVVLLRDGRILSDSPVSAFVDGENSFTEALYRTLTA